MLCSVTVGVSRFERCSLRVQLLYYPFFGGVGMANGDEGEIAEEDGAHGSRLRKSYTPEHGEPVVLRCQPYRIPLIELLLPHAVSPVEFFRLWPSLPAIAEFTGAYAYESGGPKTMTNTAGVMGEPGILSLLGGIRALSSKPFHRVCSHILETVAGFQVHFCSTKPNHVVDQRHPVKFFTNEGFDVRISSFISLQPSCKNAVNYCQFSICH